MATPLGLVIIVSLASGDGARLGVAITLGHGEPAAVDVVHSGGCGDLGPLLQPQELRLRLVGTETVRTPEEHAVERMLTDAREREARFDTAGANALRVEILRSFEHAPRPSEALRRLAAAAAHDLAAAALLEGDRASALDYVRTARTHFAGRAVDDTRHSRVVLDVLQGDLGADEGDPATAQLDVVSHEPGEIYIDGSAPYPTTGRITLALRPGRYRVWFVSPEGSSLPRVVELTEAGASIDIDAALDRRLRVEPEIALACAGPCAREMTALGHRLGVERVVGIVTRDGGGIEIVEGDVGTGEVTEVRCAAATSAAWATPSPPPRFTPLYLLPLGIAQFVQDRPMAGAIYGVAQIGVGAWHLLAWREHSAAVRRDSANEPELRRVRNISAAATYATLAAVVLEAVVVGLVTGE